MTSFDNNSEQTCAIPLNCIGSLDFIISDLF